MKIGLLERILVRRYGAPRTSIDEGRLCQTWNADKPDYSSILYVGMDWNGPVGSRFGSLKDIYGDAIGGFLVGDSLRIAALSTGEIYGIWRIDDLQTLPAVKEALEMDPDIEFFMEASNVWYYGLKDGELYVFDSEFGELDSLGPVESALEEAMDRWEDY